MDLRAAGRDARMIRQVCPRVGREHWNDALVTDGRLLGRHPQDAVRRQSRLDALDVGVHRQRNATLEPGNVKSTLICNKRGNAIVC